MSVDVTPLWQYIRERERIRLLRQSGAKFPWTTDWIFSTYKFTNVRRLHDKTTQFFLHSMYEEHINVPEYEALYNCGVFRYHGTREFATQVGWQRDHNPAFMINTARAMIDQGLKVYTGAYIVTNGGRPGFKESVVCQFLEELYRASGEIASKIEATQTWEAGYQLMRRLAGFGGSGFMAKEVLQDYILWRSVGGRAPLKDELTWTPVGPGGRRGLNRLYGRPLRFMQKESKFIAEVDFIANALLGSWHAHFPNNGSFGDHDVQFCLCEFDKYQRILNGEGRPRALYHPPA